jgi:hypothetical protein
MDRTRPYPTVKQPLNNRTRPYSTVHDYTRSYRTEPDRKATVYDRNRPNPTVPDRKTTIPDRTRPYRNNQLLLNLINFYNSL